MRERWFSTVSLKLEAQAPSHAFLTVEVSVRREAGEVIAQQHYSTPPLQLKSDVHLV